MDTYFVYSNLNHDGKEYKRGDKVSLTSSEAKRLIALEVVGTEKPETLAPASVAAQEPTPKAKVGGKAQVSGEPSIDAPEAGAAAGEAVDVTPKVSERMTREELEAVATQQGIGDDVLKEAKTKGDLVTLIKAKRADHADNEEEAVDASADL